MQSNHEILYLLNIWHIQYTYDNCTSVNIKTATTIGVKMYPPPAMK